MNSSRDVCFSCFLILSAQSRQVVLVAIHPQNLASEEVSRSKLTSFVASTISGSRRRTSSNLRCCIFLSFLQQS